MSRSDQLRFWRLVAALLGLAILLDTLHHAIAGCR